MKRYEVFISYNKIRKDSYDFEMLYIEPFKECYKISWGAMFSWEGVMRQILKTIEEDGKRGIIMIFGPVEDL